MNKHYVSAGVDRSIEPHDVPEEAAVCAAICAILLDRSGVDHRPVSWRGDPEAGPAATSGLVLDDDPSPVPLWRSVLASIAHAAEALRDRWRRERDIRRAVAALALLDDHTLRDMGIQGRAEIERVVRYCHDC